MYKALLWWRHLPELAYCFLILLLLVGHLVGPVLECVPHSTDLPYNVLSLLVTQNACNNSNV